jgi:hypothetical protein
LLTRGTCTRSGDDSRTGRAGLIATGGGGYDVSTQSIKVVHVATPSSQCRHRNKKHVPPCCCWCIRSNRRAHAVVPRREGACPYASCVRLCRAHARALCHLCGCQGRAWMQKEGGTDAHCGFEAIPHCSATRCSHRPQAVAVTSQRRGQRALPAERDTHRHGHGCQRVWEGEVGRNQTRVTQFRFSAPKHPKAFAQWGSASPSPSSIHVSWSRQCCL